MKVNLLGIAGALVSISSVVLVWFSKMMEASTFGSGDTALTKTIRSYTGDVSTLFILGALVALLTPLGAMLQMPALITFPFVIWHNDLSPYWVFGYSVALIGAALSMSSSFVQITLHGGRHIPPESRIRVWYPWKDEHTPRPIPKSVKYLLVSVVVGTALILGGTAAAAYATPMSKISVNVMVDGADYEIDNVTLMIDDRIVSVTHVAPVHFFEIRAVVNETAGSHKLSLLVAGHNLPPIHSLEDRVLVIRVLPFTTEEVLLGVGVSFA